MRESYINDQIEGVKSIKYLSYLKNISYTHNTKYKTTMRSY